MRIEPPAAQCGVTGQAVALGMAADARFESLARRLPMAHHEESPGVVIARTQHTPPRRRQSRPRVTARTERAHVVAIAAGRFARIRGSGVTRDESVRVIAGAARAGVRPVTVQAVGAHVAAGAARRGCGRFHAVPVGKVVAVTRRSRSRNNRRRSQIGCEPRDRPRRRRTGMTLIAELASVAGGASRAHGLAGNGAVAARAEKIGGGVRRRCGETSHVLPSERGGTNQRYVTGGARRIRRRQMHRLDTMTHQAALHDRLAHGHAWFADLRVTARAGRRFRSGLRSVIRVIEAKIAATRRRRCVPQNRLLDRPIVTRRARNRIWPERRSCLRGAPMTRGARGE